MQTMMTDKTIRLPDGRQLGYAECGVRDGTPLLFFHSFLGSRRQTRFIDPAARELGVRVVVPERPGYGLSDGQPKRTLLDWADDVEALADSLQLDRFAVMGISGGGPYAAATAYKLPGRVTRAVFVSTMGSFTIPGATSGMHPFNRLLSRLTHTMARLTPWAVVNCFMGYIAHNSMRKPEQFRKRFLGMAPLIGLPPVDVALLRDDEIWHAIMIDMREAFRPGTSGATWDSVLQVRPWGFRLEEILVPTYLWHGEEDSKDLVSMARAMANTIPNCQATFVPGEGHLSLVLRHMDEILGRLVAGEGD